MALLAPSARAGDAPAIAFDKSAYDFGTIDYGSSAAQTLTLRNSGGSATGALTVSLSGSSAARYSISDDTCTAAGIGPRKSCSLTVTYTPAAAGASDAATLTAKSKKATATATAALSGKSSAAPSADISLAYSDVHAPAVVTATNNGPAAATVTVRVAADEPGCWVSWVDSLLTGWSKPPTGEGCQYDFTSQQAIASGSSLTIPLQAMVPSGHAEVWSSSLPDPDSTPGNGQTAEDDYVSIPHFLWD